jgi:uncharacterized membrane protein YkoI
MPWYLFVLFGVCLAANIAALPAMADGDDDQDRAFEAVEHGEALPLSKVLAHLKGRLGGEIVGISFEREDERWIYVFKVVMPNGGMRRIHIDAKSAEPIEDEDR